MNFALILLTRNPGVLFELWTEALQRQSVNPSQVLVIDSQSEDNTVEKALANGYVVHCISAAEFNHGGTRNLGVQLLKAGIELVIFMTQDAILHTPQSLEHLVRVFRNPRIAAAYGRQLPHEDANPLAAHARYFNYPTDSSVKSCDDIGVYGIKTAFLSNAFAAYRLDVWRELGGFPAKVIFGEDMYLAAKMILQGWQTAYCAEAVVRHSHNYHAMEEFRRYFDIGVFHEQACCLLREFGQAGGEGKRFVLSEWRYLWRHAPLWLPMSCLFTLMKFAGYHLGRHWRKLPKSFPPYFSMHRKFWDD